jgi:hypothetical protein
MSLFTATGEQAKENANKKSVDLKTAYIRLKENESVRPRLLGLTDYVEYAAQGEFSLGIYTQPCIDSTLNGRKSPLTIAAESGVEGFEKLRPKKRYIFAFYDIDMQQVRFFDASRSAAKKLIGQIEEYAESIGEIAFTFKRVGTKTETSYDLLPILKLDAKGKEGFSAGDEAEVTLANFESVLIPRSEEQQVEALKTAGFPVEQYFTDNSTDVEDADYSDENPMDTM